jgi:hypothetical protein
MMIWSRLKRGESEVLWERDHPIKLVVKRILLIMRTIHTILSELLFSA